MDMGGIGEIKLLHTYMYVCMYKIRELFGGGWRGEQVNSLRYLLKYSPLFILLHHSNPAIFWFLFPEKELYILWNMGEIRGGRN